MTDIPHHHRLATVALCIVVVLTVVAAPVAAQSDEDTGIGDAILGAAVDVAEDPTAAAKSFAAWGRGIAANVGGSIGAPDRTAAECAGDLQTELTDHNATYEQYLNDRITASTSRDVVRIDCRVEDDSETTTETVYIVANVTNGTYTDTRAVDTTERVVDHRIVLSGVAAEDAPDDLETFREEYASENETPPPAYKGRMKGKYMGHVEGTFGFLPAIEEGES